MMMTAAEASTQRSRSAGRRLASLLLGLVALALVLVGCDGGAEPPPRAPGGGAPSEVAHGEELASQSCSACHGQDFKGVAGLGTSFHDNTFIQGLADDELVVFIKEGRANDAPDNESGIAMPPYGGNTRLTDDDVADIVAFLRTLQ
jgi:mono/diheme cytochrome c family protein